MLTVRSMRMKRKPTLYLEEAHIRNFEALVNFVNGVKVRRSNSRSGKSGAARSNQRQRMYSRELKKQDYKCVDCSVMFEKENDRWKGVTRDHIIPIIYGSCFLMNTELVCGTCNRKRAENPRNHIKRYFNLTEEDLTSLKVDDSC